jgi:hypothetical protein
VSRRTSAFRSGPNHRCQAATSLAKFCAYELVLLKVGTSGEAVKGLARSWAKMIRPKTKPRIQATV